MCIVDDAAYFPRPKIHLFYTSNLPLDSLTSTTSLLSFPDNYIYLSFGAASDFLLEPICFCNPGKKKKVKSLGLLPRKLHYMQMQCRRSVPNSRESEEPN